MTHDDDSIRHDTLTHLLTEALTHGRATLITGPDGSGKSHLLREAQTILLGAKTQVPLIVGTASGSSVPLGAFAGIADMPPAAVHSPAAVVDAFARRRSHTVLLVDNVELLDEASLYVVTQLISTTRMAAILTCPDLESAPTSIRDVYDSGLLTETALPALTDAEARALIVDLLGGEVTPHAEAQIIRAADGNPLHLREIVRGSQSDGRLTETPHGWDLDGSPAPTRRLADLVEERYGHLPAHTLEAATLIALTGECPSEAINAEDRRALAHAGLIDVTEGGWVTLSRPLDAVHLVSRGSSALRYEIARRAIDALRGPASATRPHAARQADVLALEYGCGIEVDSMAALAEDALGSFDTRLALRAATAVVEIEPDVLVTQHIAGLAASLLGETDTAERHFREAQRLARTDAERTSVTLAYAQHIGIRRRDATAALRLVQDALALVRDEQSVANLQAASLRWSAVAGQAHQAIEAPDESTDAAAAAMSLVTAGVAGVISGPLSETTILLPRMKEVPSALLALVHGGDTIVELTELMALSYSGDVFAARRGLTGAIEQSRDEKPEAVGVWEYALGLLEFLSADADEAYALGSAAVSHLTWRDSAGLLPAAHALTAAAAMATGRSLEAHRALESIPEAAAYDPKVVMLRAWVEAWQAKAERRVDQSAEILLDTAHWLMTAQHTYLAGMLAHCAARMGRRPDEAAAAVRAAYNTAGGGLLRILADHADAVAAGDIALLEQVVSDAIELGLVTTATDTRLWLAQVTDRRKVSEISARRFFLSADETRVRMPTVALWNATPDRSTLLTEREHSVVRLAADRYSAKEIAETHDVSVNTVTNQLASAFRKLGISSRAELRELLNS